MATDSFRVQKKRHQYAFLFFSLLVSVSVFSYLFSTVSVAEVFSLLKGLTARWIILFVLLSFSMSFFRTWRYRIVLNVSGYRPDIKGLFLITLVRNFFSDLLPARLGTLIYIYLVQNRLRVPFGPAASSFAFSFIFDMISLAFLLLLALLIGSSGVVSPLVVAGGSTVLAGGSIVVLLGLPALLKYAAHISLALPLLPELSRKRICECLKDAGINVSVARESGIYWQVFALSLGVRCFKYLSLYVLLLALVAPLGFNLQSFPLPKVFLGLCSAELAASLPVSGIGGFGAYEGTWALVFQFLGYSEHIAVLTSISHHLLTQVYGYSLGGVALLILLLPVFHVSGTEEKYNSQQSKGSFWRNLLMVTGFVLVLGFFLFPGENLVKNDSVSRLNNSAALNNDQQISGNAIKPMEPPGRIVFQRKDGLYLLDVKTRIRKRIVPFGTYPRWSPDGRSVVFVHRNDIMVTDASGRERRIVATTRNARAVCFSPDGTAVYFTDGIYLKRVTLSDLTITTLFTGDEFREIDVSGSGKQLTATVRTPFGLRVKVFDLATDSVHTIASGCSASFSPDGKLVTVNSISHKKLYLYNGETLKKEGYISAPSGGKFDNQYWSNSSEWIVSTSEGRHRDIYIHHVKSNSSFRLTDTGDCDRADLFVDTSIP